MTDLENLFSPQNKFVVPVTIHLSSENKLKLLKFINYHHLGDVDANELLDGQFVPKYPEKETEEFKMAVRLAQMGHAVNVEVQFDKNGIPTFEIEK
jgi:hypothetical protein